MSLCVPQPPSAQRKQPGREAGGHEHNDDNDHTYSNNANNTNTTTTTNNNDNDTTTNSSNTQINDSTNTGHEPAARGRPPGRRPPRWRRARGRPLCRGSHGAAWQLWRFRSPLSEARSFGAFRSGRSRCSARPARSPSSSWTTRCSRATTSPPRWPPVRPSAGRSAWRPSAVSPSPGRGLCTYNSLSLSIYIYIYDVCVYIYIYI